MAISGSPQVAVEDGEAPPWGNSFYISNSYSNRVATCTFCMGSGMTIVETTAITTGPNRSPAYRVTGTCHHCGGTGKILQAETAEEREERFKNQLTKLAEDLSNKLKHVRYGSDEEATIIIEFFRRARDLR